MDRHCNSPISILGPLAALLTSIWLPACKPVAGYKADKIYRKAILKQEYDLLAEALELFRQAEAAAPADSRLGRDIRFDIEFTEALQRFDGLLNGEDYETAAAYLLPREQRLLEYTIESERDKRWGSLIAKRRYALAQILNRSGRVEAATVEFGRVAALDPEGRFGISTKVRKKDQPKDFGEMSWEELVTRVVAKENPGSPKLPMPPSTKFIPGSTLPELTAGISYLVEAQTTLKEIHRMVAIHSAEYGEYPVIDGVNDLLKPNGRIEKPDGTAPGENSPFL